MLFCLKSQNLSTMLSEDLLYSTQNSTAQFNNLLILGKNIFLFINSHRKALFEFP